MLLEVKNALLAIVVCRKPSVCKAKPKNSKKPQREPHIKPFLVNLIFLKNTKPKSNVANVNLHTLMKLGAWLAVKEMSVII